MTLSPLLRSPQFRKTSTIHKVMHTRQKTLAQLYLRRATVERAIHSLEMYAQAMESEAAKIVALR